MANLAGCPSPVPPIVLRSLSPRLSQALKHGLSHALYRGLRRLRPAAILASVPLFILAGATANAQATTGVGDDAVPVPAGGTRIRIGGLWSSYDSRFAPSADGGTKKSALYSPFVRENLGTGDLQALAPAEASIRALSGLSAFSLSLGSLEARGDVSKSTTPFQLDVGITNRLSLSVLVPYVETTVNNRFTLNPGGGGATGGRNPTRDADGTSTATTTNPTVANQIAQSRAQLQGEIDRCGDAQQTGGACDAIRANPTGAQALITQSQSFQQNLESLYGTTTTVGAPVIPLLASPAQTAIEAQLAAMREAFLGYQSNSLDGTTKPVPAREIYGPGGFHEIVKDSAFGLAYDTLMNGGRAGIGDVDLSATFVILNTLGTQSERLTQSRKGLRASVTAGWRFGTATGGRSGNPFDLPTGDGANALLLRGTADLILNRRFWISGSIRHVKPFSDNVVTRFPVPSDSNLFRPSIELPAERTLGARTEIEIAPRLAIGHAFGVSAAYALGRQASSTLVTTMPDPDVMDAGAFGPPSVSTQAITVQTAQFGVSYSTLNGFVRGKSRWPLEVIYSHGLTLTGSGGVVPASSFDRIELRVYTRFPRR
ncbi:MAG: hypothetical protein ACO1Q7_11630 [Gemmatimonas sp.]